MKSIGNVEKHKIQLTCLSPVHIGNGSTWSRSEYVKTKSGVNIVNSERFFQYVSGRKLAESYLQAMGFGTSLNDFLKTNGLDKIDDDLRSCFHYLLACEDDVFVKRGDTFLRPEIRQFTKTNNMPYIPGSTVKGAIRSALIAWFAIHDINSGTQIKNIVNRIANASDARFDVKNLSGKIEEIANSTKVKDMMQRISVSDSNTVSCELLTAMWRKDLNLIHNDRIKERMVCEYLRSFSKLELSISLRLDINEPNKYEEISQIIGDYYSKVLIDVNSESRIGFEVPGGSRLLCIGGTNGFKTKSLLRNLIADDEIYLLVRKKVVAINSPDRHNHNVMPVAPRYHKMVDGQPPGWCVIEEV